MTSEPGSFGGDVGGEEVDFGCGVGDQLVFHPASS